MNIAVMSNLRDAVAKVRDGSSLYWAFYHPEDRQADPEIVEVRLNATPEIVADFVAPEGWQVERIQWGDTLFLRRHQSLESEAVEAMLIELLELAALRECICAPGYTDQIRTECPLPTHSRHSSDGWFRPIAARAATIWCVTKQGDRHQIAIALRCVLRYYYTTGEPHSQWSGAPRFIPEDTRPLSAPAAAGTSGGNSEINPKRTFACAQPGLRSVVLA